MFDSSENGGLLNEKAAAEILGCSHHLLRKWRRLGGGPLYHNVGRLVRYAQADLQSYMEACRVTGR